MSWQIFAKKQIETYCTIEDSYSTPKLKHDFDFEKEKCVTKYKYIFLEKKNKQIVYK